MSEQPGRYQRSFGGMIGAMVVLLVVVALFVAFRAVNRTEPTDPVKPVDYATPARFAREAARFDLLAPRELPPGWIATSVRFRDGEEQSWHLGCLTDERAYVGLEQAPEPVPVMVDEFVGEDAVRGRTVTLDGARWQTWASADGDRALVQESGDVTTVVVGPVAQPTLEELIAVLR